MVCKTEMRTVEAEVDPEVYLFFVVIGQVQFLPQLGGCRQGKAEQNNTQYFYFSPQ